MNTCDDFELDLSAFLDGELTPAAAADAFEHALGCASCAAFFRAARRLDERARNLAAAGGGLAPEHSEQLWERIRERAPADETAAFGAEVVELASRRREAPSGPGARGWLRAAALVLLGLGGGYALSSLAGPGAAPVALAAGRAVPAAVGSGAVMDEHRFVAIADELMRSDARYQRAMLQILRLVPALETGEGLGTEDPAGASPFVTAAAREERPRNGLL